VEQGTVLVFDDTLGDTTEQGGAYFITKHTSLEYTDLFSSAAQISLQVVADRLAGVADTPLTLALEHSANGYDWKPKNGVPELWCALGGGVETASFAGGERWPARPSLRFVRLRIDAGDGKNPFALNLKVVVAARMRGERSLPFHGDLDTLREHLPWAELLFSVRGEVLNELRQLVLSTGHLDEEARAGEVIRGLSERSQREVFGLVSRVRKMDVDAKRLLLSLSRGVVELLSTDLEEHEAEHGATARHHHVAHDAGVAESEVATEGELADGAGSHFEADRG
jgi:hypothetical protein